MKFFHITILEALAPKKRLLEQRKPLPIIQEFKKSLKGMRLTEAVEILQTWYRVGTDIENYYNKIYNLTRGEYQTITPEEERALTLFIQAQNNPHQLYSKGMTATPIQPKINQLKKAIRSKVYNPSNMTSLLNQIEPLSIIDDI